VTVRAAFPWLSFLIASVLSGCGPRDGSSGKTQYICGGGDGGMIVAPMNVMDGPGSNPGPDAGSFDGGCNEVPQIGSVVNEMQVDSAPPAAMGGWYPAGTFALTSATVYTGPGGATGPDGNRYAMTLDVISEGSTDLYEFVQSVSGQPDYRYAISANLLNEPMTESIATWTCPQTGDFLDGGTSLLPYDGITNGTPSSFTSAGTSVTLYVPGPNGTTIAQSFAYQHM
jgi:hypothetical protein